MGEIGFDGIKHYLTEHGHAAHGDLHAYYGEFRGRWFEFFSARSDPLHLDGNDLAACAALGAVVDGHVMSALLDHAAEIDHLIAASPPHGATLWDTDPDGHDYHALVRLHDLLRSIPGMGDVRSSVLLACKRPHLVPVRDPVVEEVLGGRPDWWTQWRYVVADPEVRRLVDAVTPPGPAESASILRRLDVILWMHGRRAEAAK